jgi:hypothetical protein
MLERTFRRLGGNHVENQELQAGGKQEVAGAEKGAGWSMKRLS